MAHSGQIIENPLTGERITFLQTAADTGGELLAFELELAPDGHVPGMHVHPLQEERFEVLQGAMRFRKGHERISARAGDVVVVPPGVPHRFANGGVRVAVVHVEVRPALRMEQLLETAVALAENGRTNRKGMPKPLDMALFVREFEAEVHGPYAPRWAQRAALTPLGWLARVFGRTGRPFPLPATS
jgi:mannose-6-phosphate isomerase-like protein (cupin superfamily)